MQYMKVQRPFHVIHKTLANLNIKYPALVKSLVNKET